MDFPGILHTSSESRTGAQNINVPAKLGMFFLSNLLGQVVLILVLCRIFEEEVIGLASLMVNSALTFLVTMMSFLAFPGLIDRRRP